MTTTENKEQHSNSKYSYLDNSHNQPLKDHLKLKHFYNYDQLKISPNKNTAYSTMNLNYDYTIDIQNKQKDQYKNKKDQLFDSRLSFQRYSPNYNRNLSQQKNHLDKYTQQNKARFSYNIEFSPFEDNQVIQKLFVQELQTQYHLVKNQLKEYEYQNQLLKEKIKSLQACNQLQIKNIQIKSQQIIQIKKQRSTDAQKFQGVIHQLKIQIQLQTKKNIELFSAAQKYQLEIQHLKTQLLYKDLVNSEKQVQKYQSKRAKQIRQPGVLYLRRQQNQIFKRKRSMPGRLLNKTYANTGLIRNQEFGLVRNQEFLQKQKEQLSQQSNEKSKVFLKYENLIQSIKNMYKKIERQSLVNQVKFQSNQIDLKNLWKWLKKLGHQYSKVQNQNKNNN